MKRLLLASILMVFGASAHAVVTVGATNCGGGSGGESCLTNVSCSNGNCDVSIDLDATHGCNGLPLNNSSETSYNLTSVRVTVPLEPDPVCQWDVFDDDGVPVVVTVDSSDGLPVELQSMSIE